MGCYLINGGKKKTRQVLNSYSCKYTLIFVYHIIIIDCINTHIIVNMSLVFVLLQKYVSIFYKKQQF